MGSRGSSLARIVLVQPTRLGNPNRVALLHVGKEMQQRDLCGARQGRAQLAIEGMPAKHLAGGRGQNAQRSVEKSLL